MYLRHGYLALLSLSLGLPSLAQQCAHDFDSLRLESDKVVRAGRLAEAESLLRRCREEWAAKVSEDDWNMVGSAVYLGQVLGLMRRWQEAETMLQKTYRQALASPQSGNVPVAAAALGSLYRYRRDTARALPLLKVALREFIQTRGALDSNVGLVLNEIGAVHADDGKLALAQSTFLQARVVLAASGSKEELMTCDLYLAAMELELGRLTEAEARIKSAQQSIGDSESALSSAGRAMSEYYLARVYQRQGHKRKADEQFQIAIAAYESARVQPFPQLYKVMEEYAEFLKKSKSPNAKVWTLRARAIRDER
jgi:tetratricopeptide (TPR) repeat protein